jgi:hypothetical protein
MPQEAFQCSKCGKIMEGYRYCMCGAHHSELKKVKVYTEDEVEKIRKK